MLRYRHAIRVGPRLYLCAYLFAVCISGWDMEVAGDIGDDLSAGARGLLLSALCPCWLLMVKVYLGGCLLMRLGLVNG